MSKSDKIKQSLKLTRQKRKSQEWRGFHLARTRRKNKYHGNRINNNEEEVK